MKVKIKVSKYLISLIRGSGNTTVLRFIWIDGYLGASTPDFILFICVNLQAN